MEDGRRLTSKRNTKGGERITDDIDGRRARRRAATMVDNDMMMMEYD